MSVWVRMPSRELPAIHSSLILYFWVALEPSGSHHSDMGSIFRHWGMRATVLLGLCLAAGTFGCKDDNPFDADFGVEMVAPLSVTWGDDGGYRRSSGERLRIKARASSRVDWRVEITSNTGGKVIRDDSIRQQTLAFTEPLPFEGSPQNPNFFSVGDSVTVLAIATPQIKPSHAGRAIFRFIILP